MDMDGARLGSEKGKSLLNEDFGLEPARPGTEYRDGVVFYSRMKWADFFGSYLSPLLLPRFMSRSLGKFEDDHQVQQKGLASRLASHSMMNECLCPFFGPCGGSLIIVRMLGIVGEER